MRYGFPLVLSLALMTSIASAQVSNDASADGGSESVDAEDYRSIESRYTDRMTELDADTRRFLSLREDEERGKLVSGYDQLISTLSEMEDDNRLLTRERMQAFLEQYPDTTYASHVRFRLADLLYVGAKTEWLRTSEEYSVLEAQLIDEERWEEIPPQPMVDLGPTIELYQRIIRDNVELPSEQQYEHLDGAFYMLGFSYNESTSAQRDEDLAKQAFLDLIRVSPESELVDAAQLFLGNIAFDNNDFPEAIARYSAVYENGEDGAYFDNAIYQLAWTYYKLAGPNPTEISMGRPAYGLALGLFTDIMDRADVLMAEEGRESAYAPDALKYMAISFSDISDFDEGTSALRSALTHFEATSPRRDYEWDILNELGETLTQQARFGEAVEVYRYMQDDPRWTLRPENPSLMYKVAELLASGIENDQDAAYAAVVELTERYNDDTEWWAANRNNPDALAVARRFIEDSLADVAVDYHTRARQSGDVNDYLAAADKYREYLEKFPIADDFYQKQFYLADALFQAKAYDDSSDEYASLIRSTDNHPYADIGFLRIAEASRLRMEDAVEGAPLDAFDASARERAEAVQAPLWTVPAAGFIERMETASSGFEYPVYALSAWHEDFMAGHSGFNDHTFTEPPDDVADAPDLREVAEIRRPKYAYMMAQVYYTHNQFEKAEELIRAVIAEDRRSVEAGYAAGLHVNMYTYLGDLGQVRELAKQYLVDMPGPLDGQSRDDLIAGLADTLEGSTFKAALNLVDTDREAAAEAFLAFVEEFPESQYASVALYNAANSYDVAGKSERAIELFERYVAEYPDSEEARRLYFRIAATYESTLELDQAIGYYEQLIRNFPDDQNAADALYNAAFLKIGLGRYEEAAEGFEQYATQYPDKPDAEDVFWRAAEQWEAVSPDAAQTYYRRYLQGFGMSNPDHAFAAKQSQAEFYDDSGDTRRASGVRDDIVSDYDRMVTDGVEVGQMGRHYAAEAAFRDIQAEFEVFTALVLTGDEQGDVDLIITTMPEQMLAFEETAAAYVGKYGDFEYSTAALLRIGQAYLHYVTVGYSIEPPADLPPELEDAFFEALETNVYPRLDNVQDKGRARLQRVIDFATERKRYSDYVGEAKTALNESDPINYPADKTEVRGETEASSVFEPTPIRPVPVADVEEGGE
jgi:TolA-binding protein